jgi:ubiquinone/menaquinone biosynthesis C-methylase UbiE
MKTLASLTLLTLTVAAAQSPRSTIESSQIFSALNIQPGHTVGEIGAGNGDLTIEVAQLVGGNGKVLTSELGDRVGRLERAVKSSGHAHITVVTGDPNKTNFAEACCDAIFMRNVYHHFADPAAMNASVFQSLKPGGRVAIVDFEPNRGRPEASSPADRDNDDSHGTTAATVARELTEAGFQIVQTEPGNNRWFMVVGTRPH